jgi:hypothetical protein
MVGAVGAGLTVTVAEARAEQPLVPVSVTE